GGNSPVREHCGFRTREWHYGQKALVCSVRTTLPHAFTARQCFLPSGPLAFLPLALPQGDEQRYCSIVWSCDETLADELLALPEDDFAQRLAAGIDQCLGPLSLLDTPRAFALQQRHATEYVQERVALVGDAAHTIHPLAGQGINMGFADARVLAEVLQHALRRGEPWYGVQVLSRYQRRRKPENLAMMLGMEGFKRGFGSDALWLRYLRNQGLKLADGLPPLKHALMRRAMGLRA
ncbi:MAG TPA: 2-octaprenyl-3-methyl-6-methoxy-1,4-benzoquinol hydroxylase, partial [Pseudomonadaceae bacterium]|nr:2-octaprenyl-3-methyl-6-methoxy-1,4-benzoquinol hydroxylase [Pseudomonadaceae bacterium]